MSKFYLVSSNLFEDAILTQKAYEELITTMSDEDYNTHKVVRLEQPPKYLAFFDYDEENNSFFEVG